MRKIRRGDEVEVISGRNKGQRGKVRINLIDEEKVVVEGVNIVVKHIKRGRARQAGRVEVEAPMPVSKVMLICPSCGAKTRVGVRAGDDGKNARYCKRCDKTIARPTVD
ncbi:MAG: 50S ribosomal protein L24 [Thermomicrobiales bacterium]|jgi:large subunit ribosomal protein L24|nr:50S ribosomal protein L24 [Thermomicrobiales bacterium]